MKLKGFGDKIKEITKKEIERKIGRHVKLISFLLGLGFIIIGVAGVTIADGSIGKLVHILEDMSTAIGTALVVSSVVIWLNEYVSKKVVQVYGDKPGGLPDLIKDMNSELLRLGISLSEIWAEMDDEELRKKRREEILNAKGDPQELNRILERNEIYNAIIAKIKESKSELNFRFLYLDKNSKFLRQREIEEDGQKTGRLREEVICTEEIFKAIKMLYQYSTSQMCLLSFIPIMLLQHSP